MGSGQRFVGSSVYSHIGLAIILQSTPHAPALLAKICSLADALVLFASYSINNLSWSRADKDYLFPPFTESRPALRYIYSPGPSLEALKFRSAPADN
jgi:hypothetical protein